MEKPIYIHAHGTTMGTKMAVAFANIFMAKVETDILSQSAIKLLIWKHFIDYIFSLWNISRDLRLKNDVLGY